MMLKRLIYLLLFFVAITSVNAQEDNPFIVYDVPSQNLLKYNRFLINPTFSTVREDKSYVNLLHRNQSISFDDNNQTYFLSYSGRIGDRSGTGLSLYTQKEGVLSNYGVLANYAYGLKLSEKSNFTFGANISYYNSGIDRSRLNPGEVDPLLNGFQESSLLTFQPGFNISYGKFDFGLFAENLFDYNLKTSESLSEFKDKTFSGHLQYTHQFENGSGIMEQARLMPLAKVRKIGEEEIVLGGNLILDLPKLGWVQGGYDSFYGASAGVGFNLNKRLSLGYTMEKGLSGDFDNFGLTHEISLAYSFTPNLTEDRVMLEEDNEQLVDASNEIEDEATLDEKDTEIERLKLALDANNDYLAELTFKTDSVEANRQKDLERRFEMVMKMVRRQTQGNRPSLEEQAKKVYFAVNDKDAQLQIDAISKKSDAVAANATNSSLNNIKQQSKISKKLNDIKNGSISNSQLEADKFAQVAKKNNIKNKRFHNLKGVDNGYYIVANVYKGSHYLNKFIADLKEKGVEATYFTNPNNGLKYVYLERFDNWKEALALHKSNANGKYAGDLWIMNVDNRVKKYTNRDKSYASNLNNIKKPTKFNTPDLQKNVVKKPKVNKIPAIQRLKLNGIDSGYYIIANVFANTNNANRFVKLLNTKGLNASYFVNPENNYRYVYLKKHGSWNNALISYYSNLNHAYDDKMWIMRVTPNQLT